MHERFNAGPEGRMEAFQDIIARSLSGENPFSSDDAARSIWADFVERAEDYNDPGVFTAMTGFEWTSTPGGNNLHRVVIFRDGADKTGRTIPYTMFESDDPEETQEIGPA